MSDQQHQKISQFLDNDLSQLESLQLLSALREEPELQASINRYQLIGQALKARPNVMAKQNFVDQIQQQLANEPVYLLPRAKVKSTQNRYATAALALAASIAAVAVLAPAVMEPRVGYISPLASTEHRKPDHNPTQMLVAKAQKEIPRHYPVNKRFEGYLLAHNDNLYTVSLSSFQNQAQ